ncbi:hypothetical protein GPECTOR_6g740 [Gonium pectorale]|uniref:Peptidase M11 gametolysin domain-containing protein n=1 Tax=Gonium pectorale TaxID=33097 RepID=A0A150GVU0_GONPE|nr:hypothetical protein GPECTOR_6g740 [Gonium pectorale]|eukprot:KXZ53822.1 hypothetical protein GPECTOR_6g740 [Gonium pectorale]
MLLADGGGMYTLVSSTQPKRLFAGLTSGGLARVGSSKALAEMLYGGLTPFTDYVATCSYGKARFDQQNTRILTVKLPCNGTGHVTGMRWTSDSCSQDNLFNWMYEVEYYIDNVLKPPSWNHRRFRHHIIITPRNMTGWAGAGCDWSGVGSVGMAQGSWSYAWISGDSWQTKQVYLHEMGHNYNLMHAATLENGSPDSCSHCDWSSAMGFCCDTRCMSAPHSWQMGWAKPAAVVSVKQLTRGNTLAYELPSAIMSDAHYLQVTTNWLNNSAVSESAASRLGGSAFYSPANASFLFSYRLRFDDFDEVPDGFSGGTNVHLFTVDSQYDLRDSVHLALLTADSPVWTDPSGTLVVRQVAADNMSAIVTVCRPEPEASYEQCMDFWDNDCDGLIGEAGLPGLPPSSSFAPTIAIPTTFSSSPTSLPSSTTTALLATAASSLPSITTTPPVHVSTSAR